MEWWTCCGEFTGQCASENRGGRDHLATTKSNAISLRSSLPSNSLGIDMLRACLSGEPCCHRHARSVSIARGEVNRKIGRRGRYPLFRHGAAPHYPYLSALHRDAARNSGNCADKRSGSSAPTIECSDNRAIRRTSDPTIERSDERIGAAADASTFWLSLARTSFYSFLPASEPHSSERSLARAVFIRAAFARASFQTSADYFSYCTWKPFALSGIRYKLKSTVTYNMFASAPIPNSTLLGNPTAGLPESAD